MFCPYCGRTYNVKICGRGHINARTVQFCPQCGSAEFSTPAAVDPLHRRLLRGLLWVVVWVVLILLSLTVVTRALASLNFSALGEPVARLLLLLALMYWVVSKLPAWVRRAGKAGGRSVIRMIRNRRNVPSSRRER
jgi:hypothetical protein